MILLHQLDLSLIIEGCRELSRQRQHTEHDHCFELFRRAIEEANEQAWQALKEQYDGLIHHWIISKSASPLSLQDREDLVQNTWLYFHRAIQSYRISLVEHFAHVGSLLKYLNNCAYTALVKHWKARQKAKRLEDSLKKLELKIAFYPEENRLADLLTEERLVALKRWCEQYLNDPLEQIVFNCSFKKGLKPKEIAEAFPEYFPDAKAVSLCKEKLLKRIKRYFIS